MFPNPFISNVLDSSQPKTVSWPRRISTQKVLWKTFSFPFLLVVNSFIIYLYSLHSPYLTVNQQNYSHLHSQVWTPILLSWSLWKPQARTSVAMSLLHTSAGWPSIKDENHTSTTQMTTANPWSLTLTFSVAHHPFVILFSDYEKKLSTSSSVSKHLILCRCPTGTKVVRHWSARSWWCYWLIQPGLGVLINNLTEHQHWKRPLCARDVFCLKVFCCCCCRCFGNRNYIYIYFFFFFLLTHVTIFWWIQDRRKREKEV